VLWVAHPLLVGAAPSVGLRLPEVEVTWAATQLPAVAALWVGHQHQEVQGLLAAQTWAARSLSSRVYLSLPSQLLRSSHCVFRIALVNN
jgi:hypothetical protein